MRIWLAIAGIYGFLAVAAGAFGAHGLKGRFGTQETELFTTAVRYQMWHALALLAVAWLASRGGDTVPGAVTLAGAGFAAGVLLFSGSLYVMAFTDIRALAPVTPVGGGLLLAGWAALVYAAFTLERV